jgi:hypothetical protein
MPGAQSAITSRVSSSADNVVPVSKAEQKPASLPAQTGAAAAAAGVGLALGEPVIAGALGPAIGEGIRRLEGELEARGLTPWRRRRINIAVDVAAREIRARLDRGEEPRVDWSEVDNSGRTNVEELLEQICGIAADAPDEGKLPYLGSSTGRSSSPRMSCRAMRGFCSSCSTSSHSGNSSPSQ